ncbi:MAG: MarC family protein [Nitrospirota bacterium]|jgi:multiple antibiotic resistance protein
MDIQGFLSKLPNTFIPLFVAIDPFWLLPLFMSLTSGATRERKRGIIRQSLVTALVVSFAFAALGELIFGVLGITVNDFKIAGGLLLLVLAILDLTSTEYKEKLASSQVMGVVPIGVPLIAGPAVLTSILVLVDHYGMAATMTALTLNFLVLWASLSFAARIVEFLGTGGVAALSKIMAILLASIAVMMIRLGVAGYIAKLT